MTTLIQTPRSFLNIYNFENEALILSCIEEIKYKLLENPEILVFGKKGTQHRSVGFFSNTSIGYRYSGQLAKSQPLTSNLSILLKTINIKI